MASGSFGKLAMMILGSPWGGPEPLAQSCFTRSVLGKLRRLRLFFL